MHPTQIQKLPLIHVGELITEDSNPPKKKKCFPNRLGEYNGRS